MKQWLIVVMIALSSSLFAMEPERIETLSSKVILKDTNGYFVLSDKSCWKVVPFMKRWRSVMEWWNNEQLVPTNFNCVPSDWYLGAQIAVYPKYQNLEADEANAYNRDTLKQCTHMFVNTASRQVLFAIAMDPAECIIRVFQDAHTDGYQEGYVRGGNNSSTLDRSLGYQEGYSDGYRDGLREAD